MGSDSTRGQGRISQAEAVSLLRQARASSLVPSTLDAVGAPLAVLNTHRQIIYANTAFVTLTGGRTVDEACGSRPGEVLGCVHAREGCGESEWCGFCGALLAFHEAQQTGRPVARECHIAATGAEKAFDLLVHATPFAIDGQPYVLVSFDDISHQKRRLALERIFFHDILNTTSSFRVYLDLLRRGIEDEDARTLMGRLASICDTLEEEIQGQKIMLSAESGTLEVQRNLIDARGLAEQLTAQVEGLEIAAGRTVSIAPFSEPFAFISDDSIVKRILFNMLKNALEASPEGAVVTIGFRKDKEDRATFSVHNPGHIEPEVQRRIFQRYFSTKGDGRGLGTWGMKLLAEEYLRGSVSFRTSAGEGTFFDLSLPLRPSGQ
jgi:signal transduction histidine kinase